MVDRIMNEMYHDTPDGLEGNEDCGQMSAWYVLSALGFYPVTPGTTNYIIGTPLFSSATIHLENGRTFTINADNVSDRNYYIQSATLNNKLFAKSFIDHADIANGGSLNFSMGATSSSFGAMEIPVTSISDHQIVLNPVVDGGSISFKDKKTIKIGSTQKGLAYYYSMDGSVPTKNSRKYTAPFTINKSSVIKAIALNTKNETSFITTAMYRKAPHNWTIRLNTAYEQQYDGNGTNGLIDDIRGEVDWRKGNWQGYQNADLDVVIDLQRIKSVSTVNIGLLQDSRAWIVMPRQVIIEVSVDNKNFSQVFSGENFLPIEDEKAQLKTVEAAFATVSARYVRVKALQYGKLPSWHLGAGGDTHIFADEIIVQ